MEKTRFIRDLKPKEDVDTLFFVKHLEKVETRDGRFYLDAHLTDATGLIQARKWQEIDSIIQEVSPGDYARVKGKINLFQNRIQLIISKIKKVDENDINSQEFVRQAKENPEIMYAKLIKLIEHLDDVYIKKLLENILQDPQIMERLKKWQAGKTIHHAYQGGLLEHILSCSELAISLAPRYDCDKNYVVAGAVLHDLCKIYELTSGPLVEYTHEGKLVGHLVEGLELLNHFTRKIPKFPNDTKIHLKHILLAHHGYLEYGSPKLPMTPEAFLVYLIDNLDSKMNSISQFIQLDSNVGQWTSLSKHLNQTFFKEVLPHYPENKKNKADGLKFKNNTMAKQLEKFSTHQ